MFLNEPPDCKELSDMYESSTGQAVRCVFSLARTLFLLDRIKISYLCSCA